MKKINKILKEETGLGVVEIGLIILVIIALVVIFKDRASDFLDVVFNKADATTF